MAFINNDIFSVKRSQEKVLFFPFIGGTCLPRPRSEDNVAVGGSDDDDLESESCGNFYSMLLFSVVGKGGYAISLSPYINVQQSLS